jgi:hypothetical protein
MIIVLFYLLMLKLIPIFIRLLDGVARHGESEWNKILHDPDWQSIVIYYYFYC